MRAGEPPLRTADGVFRPQTLAENRASILDDSDTVPPIDVVIQRIDRGAGAACAEILATLPTWFGIPEANTDYANAADEHPSFVAFADGGTRTHAIGITTVTRFGAYAAEVHLYRRRGYAIDIVQFPDTDFAAIARGYGARAATVRTVDDLEPVRSWVREGAPGVFVIDGKINPYLEADWHAEHFPN